MKKKYIIASITFSLALSLIFLLSFFYASRSTHSFDWGHLWTTSHAKSLGFDLRDPEQAPPDLRASVERGYLLIRETPKYAKNYVGDKITCSNCHFAAGDTLGGKNNGISLVGVTAVYPKFSKRDNQEISLAERVNNCFMRSMNGQPLPKNSQEMQDILNYLRWISKEFEHITPMPWLGLRELSRDSLPNLSNGRQQYQLKCSPCHGGNGAGSPSAPPLWGQDSFNDGAGMNNIDTFSAFIHANMPLNDAFLTEQEAWDIAAFVVNQPRPRFELKK